MWTALSLYVLGPRLTAFVPGAAAPGNLLDMQILGLPPILAGSDSLRLPGALGPLSGWWRAWAQEPQGAQRSHAAGNLGESLTSVCLSFSLMGTIKFLASQGWYEG